MITHSKLSECMKPFHLLHHTLLQEEKCEMIQTVILRLLWNLVDQVPSYMTQDRAGEVRIRVQGSERLKSHMQLLVQKKCES